MFSNTLFLEKCAAYFKTNENLILVKEIEVQNHPNKYIRITFQHVDVLDHFSQGVAASIIYKAYFAIV